MGFDGSSDADLTWPYICTEQRARFCVKSCPVEIKFEHCSIAARRAALYASEMMIAKYLGRKKGGAVSLTRSNRSFNHFAGLARLGNTSTCLERESDEISYAWSVHSLEQTAMNVIERPGTLAQMAAERMT